MSARSGVGRIRFANLLGPRRSDYLSPRGNVPLPLVYLPDLDTVRAQQNEEQRVKRQEAAFQRAVMRADDTKAKRAHAIYAARGVLRALEDLEHIDRIGMLPQGIERLNAAMAALQYDYDRVADSLEVAVGMGRNDRLDSDFRDADPRRDQSEKGPDAATEGAVDAAPTATAADPSEPPVAAADDAPPPPAPTPSPKPSDLVRRVARGDGAVPR